MPLRILVADDHEVIRCVVGGILSSRPGWEVCWEASNGREAIDKVAELSPDIVLLDRDMPDLDGLETARAIVKANPTQNILVLTSDVTEQAARAIFDSGARGFVVKANAAHDLVSAVEALRQGRTHFTPRVAGQILNGYLKGGARREGSDAPLSDRERETINLLAKEFSDDFGQQRGSRKPVGPARKYFGIAALVIVSVVLVWITFGSKLQEGWAMDKLFVSLRLKTPTIPARDNGNPDAKVWIDLHTALYYCPGTGPYGETVRGKFTSQRAAQLDHFEPAFGKVCD